MSQAQTTICPKCGTGFQVTPQQLSKANGKVRCGACLHVFVASENIAGQVQVGSVVKKRDEGIPSFTSDDDDSSMFMFGDEMSDISFDDEPEFDSPANSSAKTSSQSSQTVSKKSSAIDDDDEFIFQDSPDDDLIEDGDADDFLQDKGLEEALEGMGELNEDFLNAGQDDSMDPFEEEVNKASDEIELTGKDEEDERWAEALLAEEDTKPQPKQLEIVKAKPDPMRHVSRIQAAPVEIELAESKSWLPTILWLLGCAILVVVLLAQYAIYNIDKLAQKAEYRGMYIQLCNITGCELPMLQDVSKIKSRELQLKAAKEANKHQAVVIMRNQAAFDQAFPMIRLKFSNSANRLIALEEITPEQYLKGDLASLEAMPANIDLQLSFLVDSPTAEVSSWQIEFAPYTR